MQKPALFSDGGSVSSAMKNPNNDQFAGADLIVNGIGVLKRHAYATAEWFMSGSHQRRLPYHLYGLGNTIKEPGRDRFTRLRRNVGPDFGEVGFCGVGETKG